MNSPIFQALQDLRTLSPVSCYLRRCGRFFEWSGRDLPVKIKSWWDSKLNKIKSWPGVELDLLQG